QHRSRPPTPATRRRTSRELRGRRASRALETKGFTPLSPALGRESWRRIAPAPIAPAPIAPAHAGHPPQNLPRATGTPRKSRVGNKGLYPSESCARSAPVANNRASTDRASTDRARPRRPPAAEPPASYGDAAQVARWKQRALPL